jgi:hypothetical protein
MKFIISLILIAVLSFAACLYFPWWSIAITTFIVVAVIPQRPGSAFLCGFLALFFLWTALSFSMSSHNDHLLAHKMSQVILKTDNPWLLIVATGLIGGIVAGCAALAAGLIRKNTVKQAT